MDIVLGLGWLAGLGEIKADFGGVLLESASVHDFDQREMFYMYLSTGDIQSDKVCTITVNFVGVHAMFNIIYF